MRTHATRHYATYERWLRPNTADTWSNDVDWIAVERAANNDLNPHALTTAEKREVWRLLISRGIGYTTAAERTGTSGHVVREWAAQHGYLPPATAKTAA
jgi:hypothetical protein